MWTSSRDPDTVFTVNPMEVNGLQDLIQLDMPSSASLLQSIYGLTQPPNPFLSLLHETLWLVHKYRLLWFAIEECRGYVDALSFKVI